MINLPNLKHILISRIDNIGDVTLTLPMAGILKERFPNVKITFLCREYARGIVEQCSYVDAFYNWDELSTLSTSNAIKDIKAHQFDVIIHALPRKKVAVLMRKAGVKYRVSPSSRLYYWLTCNKRVSFSRKKSHLHEAQINLNLLKPLNIDPSNHNLDYLHEKMGLRHPDSLPDHIKAILKPDRFNLIIHPFTNGHTREWPVSHFIELINQLPKDEFNLIITGSKNENDVIQNTIMSKCRDITNFAGQCNLSELIKLISHADGLVANATGPMHLASVFNIHTLGLFPVTKGIDASRWRPFGKKAEFLSADANCNRPSCRDKNDCFCMESITVSQVKEVIMRWQCVR